MFLDIPLISNSCFYSCLPGGAFVFVRVHGSCDIKVGYHIYIGQSGRHWSMTLLGGYQGHDALMPSTFFRNFSKNSDNFVETNRTRERFFDGNSNSRKVKMTACMG
jgi:hypothetical protein